MREQLRRLEAPSRRLGRWFGARIAGARKAVGGFIRARWRVLLAVTGVAILTWGVWGIHEPSARIILGLLLYAEANNLITRKTPE